MKTIWTFLEQKNWDVAAKRRAFLWILELLSGLLGLAAWGIVQLWTLKTIDWMFCFLIYPVMISRFVYFQYMCCHSFHSGRTGFKK